MAKKDFKQASEDFLQYITSLKYITEQTIPQVEKILDPSSRTLEDASKEQLAEVELREVKSAIKDVMAGYEDILKSIGMYH